MNCSECYEDVKTLLSDPRRPPLDEEPCLCNDCYDAARDERVEELQQEIDELIATKKVCTRSKNRGS